MGKDKANKGLRCMTSSIKKFYNCLVEKFKKLDSSSNTKQRIITSLFLIPLAVYAIFFSPSLFLFFSIAIAMMMMIEWLDMIKKSPDEKKWRIIGFFYILIPIFAVCKLRMISVDVLFWMFSIIWVTDIFAFFAGRALGGPKLAPNISPNKTWSGLAGGTLASAVIGFITSFMFNGGEIIFFVTASVLLSLIEQASDLTESKFKRIFGVKDSGNIIPGHGGVLDRLDGMIFSAPFVLILVIIFAKKFGLN